MNIADMIADFQRAGFHDLREMRETVTDVPLTYYPHDHVYVILEGTMEISFDGHPVQCREGFFLFVPAGRFHRRRVGRTGCRYVVAKRIW